MKCFRTVAKLIKWRCYPWLPSYMWSRTVTRNKVPPKNGKIDIIVAVVDHFEPSRKEGEKGVRKVKEWCENYKRTASRHEDSDGVNPQHSWFYRYDYPNYECIRILSEYVFQRYGEIEFHLHHGNDGPESFATTIEEGVSWFNQAGAMVSAEETPQRKFAYIAGDWALDNGRRDASTSGVNMELELLRKAGCYADFTFPAFGISSQPRKVNAIYYATDTPAPKSYNTGVDVEVGKRASGDLMIVQGPLYVDWKQAYIEYAAFESFTPYERRRVDYWANTGIHVRGRPEWIFVKLHMHGMQSMETVLGAQSEQMFTELEQRFNNGRYRLHYVTARELYNIVKAAEAGESGDPNDYRDYCIAPPVNRFVYCNAPYTVHNYSATNIDLEIHETGQETEICFHSLPVRSLKGARIRRVKMALDGKRGQALGVEGEGDCRVSMADGTCETLALAGTDPIAQTG